ncbi:(E)-4-hydroxy-3-methylbut-2-enyl-diphosphate synthase [Chlamydiifrater phoenicopteri]|uniref:(E)-4-hydroxy-3-methylbut-2-enyl-diphosphate synthase n=1 Tax=Chlamydiifrater phoenicopteri TaxID=2681469 RepID=UPI001BCB72E9|nr:(E)-4-hydroxy-3-methylbut-2-enyl-diphosphate synthase [Chlamydiifrater phoenicopteri]
MLDSVASFPKNIYRRKTRSVNVGHVQVGSDHPIRIQSMTNTATDDVEGTVKQILELSEAGCEIARVTVQGMKEVRACEKIKERLDALKCTIPLVADIHFFPPAAIHVADFVDKVRINPGNYADKRYLFEENRKWSDKDFERGFDRIRKKFLPLVNKCKALGKSMRIGVNHGSLSERILQKYGNTPLGLVVSALEYTQICVEEDFHELIFSIKSSNVIVMTESYRLLAKELDDRGWHYPLHLGVTEAGMDLEGSIKSATGIGALLIDGIGDTIRCSITGHPVIEMPTCNEILSKLSQYHESLRKQQIDSNDYLQSAQQAPKETLEIHQGESPSVFPLFLVVNPQQVTHSFLSDLGVIKKLDGYKKSSTSPDAIVVDASLVDKISLPILQSVGIRVLTTEDLVSASGDTPGEWPRALSKATDKLVFYPSESKIVSTKEFLSWKSSTNSPTPIFLAMEYANTETPLGVAVSASMDLSSFLINDQIQGVIFNAPLISLPLMRRIGFTILQGTRKRSSVAEMIACPSCGRTLFDLPTVTAKIQALTAHLSGLKIAVMGCIVNGPGELADADFGYIGSKPGLIDLYVKHRPVRRDIPMEEAEEALVQLLKEYNVWVDPEETTD